MFGIGRLEKKIETLDLIRCEQHMRAISSIHADINFIVQKLAELELENNKLKQQLLKEKGRIVLTICNSSLHQ